MDSNIYYEEDSNEASESLDLQRYVLALKRRWWVVALVTLIVTSGWVVYLKMQPPVYEATALIRFKNYGGISPELAQSRIQELTSRSFAERVVAQLGLTLKVDPENEEIARNEVFAEFSTTHSPVSGRYVLKLTGNGVYTLVLLDPERKKEEVVSKGPSEEIIDQPKSVNGMTFRLNPELALEAKEIPFQVVSFRSAVKSLRSRTKVNMSRSGNLMSVTLTDTDPFLVAKTTNRLAETFVEESMSIKRETIRSRRQILEEQVRIAKRRLDESDRALKAFKERYSVDLDEKQSDQLRYAAELDRQKLTLENYQKSIQELLDHLDGQTNGGSLAGDGIVDLRYVYSALASHNAFEDDPAMGIQRSKLEDLQRRYADLPSENPRAKQLAVLIAQVQKEIERLAREKLVQLDADIQKVSAELARVNRGLRQLPERQYQLSELTRDLKVKEELYSKLLADYQEAKISEAVETEDIDILDPAIRPEAPTNRNKKVLAIMGAMLGLSLGVGLVFVLEALDRSLKSVDDIKRYLKLPVLGMIPQIDFGDVYDLHDAEKIKQIDYQLVTHDYSPTAVGEAYRSLRTNILFSKTAGQVQTMVITSTAPGDGKSFTAANLAITMAQHKSNTLLVDTDLRRGVLHNTFGVPKTPGFSDYLVGSVSDLAEIMQETHVPNLSLITCGPLVPNPSELLGSHRMKRFLDEVRRKFDFVIFDSPPLNAATDAVVIGTQVNATLIVVRAGSTNRDVARQKLELFENVPANVLGVVLNGAPADLAHEGYSYYHY
jgi:tyrosine-protein kinase Etk/Wzc